jgi:ferritin
VTSKNTITQSKQLYTMKNILYTSINNRTIEMLNQQASIECESSFAYLHMASWCHTRGYMHSADYFYKQSEEEREHMLKIIKYINDVGGVSQTPITHTITHVFESFRSLFEISLQTEQKVTRSIHSIADHCLVSKDFTTFNFIQWYIDEQKEEEITVNRILELFDIIGDQPSRQYEIDKEVGKLIK